MEEAVGEGVACCKQEPQIAANSSAISIKLLSPDSKLFIGAILKRILNILILAILAGLAIVYFTLGPNVFFGGPSKNAIIDISRQVMIATSPSPAEAELAKTAKISPTGICNPDDGKYACGVEVTVDGAAPKTFVTVLKKGANGNWLIAE